MAASQDNSIQFDESFVLETDDNHPDYSLTVDILSDLYAIRFRSYFRYLDDWNPYTDIKGIKLRSLARRAAEHNEQAMLEISNLIEGFGSTPKKLSFPQNDMHSTYTSWENILPYLINSQREILSATETSLSALVDAPGNQCVLPTLEKHLTCDRQVLQQLEAWLTQFN